MDYYRDCPERVRSDICFIDFYDPNSPHNEAKTELDAQCDSSIQRTYLDNYRRDTISDGRLLQSADGPGNWLVGSNCGLPAWCRGDIGEGCSISGRINIDGIST